MATSTIVKPEVYPVTQTTTGITTTSNVSSISAGGYVRVGNVIILNIRLSLTSTGKASGSHTYLKGLPRPVEQQNFSVAIPTNQHGLMMYMNVDGEIMKNSSSASISTDTIILETVYVTCD